VVICTKGLAFHLTVVVNVKILLTAVLLTTSTLVSQRQEWLMSLSSCGNYLGSWFYYELSSPLELTKCLPFLVRIVSNDSA
jgi:hypothetical protein